MLNPHEVQTLIGLLQRLHENLPAVETATARYVGQRFATAPTRRLGRNKNQPKSATQLP